MGFLVSNNSTSPVVDKSKVLAVDKREVMPHISGVYF